jgi:hypothetical protein
MRKNAAVHHSKNCALMSQMGHKQTSRHPLGHVRFPQKQTSLGLIGTSA